jgi:cobalamin biosynthesis protein CobD/CbiB
MAKKENLEEFLADYREWVDHRHNPYYWVGTISNFALRAFRNRPKPKRVDGIVLFGFGLLFAAIAIGVVWATYGQEGDGGVLPPVLLSLALGILFAIRGLSIITGSASDMDDRRK